MRRVITLNSQTRIFKGPFTSPAARDLQAEQYLDGLVLPTRRGISSSKNFRIISLFGRAGTEKHLVCVPSIYVNNRWRIQRKKFQFSVADGIIIFLSYSQKNLLLFIFTFDYFAIVAVTFLWHSCDSRIITQEISL